MQHGMSIMAKQAATRLLAALGMSVALLGCMSDPPSHARSDGSCFIGGCSLEVCSDRTDLATPCIWRDGYACFRDATCARQDDGACGWTQSAELKACLASHDPLPH